MNSKESILTNFVYISHDYKYTLTILFKTYFNNKKVNPIANISYICKVIIKLVKINIQCNKNEQFLSIIQLAPCGERNRTVWQFKVKLHVRSFTREIKHFVIMF